LLLMLGSLVVGESGHCTLEAGCPGTGPADHWPLVANADDCKKENCSKEMASCLLDPSCVTHFTCPQSCQAHEQSGFGAAAVCAFDCSQAGVKSATFTDMLRCWGTHHCQESRPQPGGACRAKAREEGSQDITSLEQISGEWWVSVGWNCGPSTLDFASCMHWNVQGEQGKNRVVVALPQGDSVAIRGIKQQITLPYNGVVRATYGGEEPHPGGPVQEEEYHIIDHDPSHLLILWCHGMPEVRMNGAIVLSRTKELVPKDILARFQRQVGEHGMDPEDLCVFHNQGCTN